MGQAHDAHKIIRNMCEKRLIPHRAVRLDTRAKHLQWVLSVVCLCVFVVDIELMGVQYCSKSCCHTSDRLQLSAQTDSQVSVHTHILMPKEHDIVFLLDTCSIIVISLCL